MFGDNRSTPGIMLRAPLWSACVLMVAWMLASPLPCVGEEVTGLSPLTENSYLSPSGTHWMYLHGRGSAQRLRIADLAQQRTFAIPVNPFEAAMRCQDHRWSPCSRYVAVVSERGLWVFDFSAASWRTLAVQDNPGTLHWRPRWSPGSEWVLYGRPPAEFRDGSAPWYVVPSKGGVSRAVGVLGARFSPDGRWIASWQMVGERTYALTIQRADGSEHRELARVTRMSDYTKNSPMVD